MRPARRVECAGGHCRAHSRPGPGAAPRPPPLHTPPSTMAPPPVLYAFVARGADVLAELPGAARPAEWRAAGQACLERCPPGASER